MTTLQRHSACASAAAFALFLLLAFPAGRATLARQNPADSKRTTQPPPTPTQTPAAAGADSSGLVKLTVTVTDKAGRFVTGLSREAFSISEGKAQAEPGYFSAEEEPQSVGVVFDVSPSMGRAALDFARGALVRFMRQSHRANEYFILGFNDQPHLLADWTRDGKTIIEALNKLGHLAKTGTALYDALDAGVAKVGRGPQPKRVIVLISDGQDSRSRTHFTKLRELIKRSDVIIYAVGITDGGYESALGYGGRAILEELAGVSGGCAYFPSGEAAIDDAFRRIGLELHAQYVIGYRPAKAAADGKWRKREIKVKPPVGWPRLYVRGREGYYVAAAPTSP